VFTVLRRAGGKRAGVLGSRKEESRNVCCFVVPFLVVWIWMFSSQMRFFYNVAPGALARWSHENGYRIEKHTDQIWFQGPRGWHGGAFRRIYRVKVRDRSGASKDGWLRVGLSWWPCLSVEECPVEVQWDRAELPLEPTIPLAASEDHPLWDRELD
jgi:hypothetical protein